MAKLENDLKKLDQSQSVKLNGNKESKFRFTLPKKNATELSTNLKSSSEADTKTNEDLDTSTSVLKLNASKFVYRKPSTVTSPPQVERKQFTDVTEPKSKASVSTINLCDSDSDYGSPKKTNSQKSTENEKGNNFLNTITDVDDIFGDDLDDNPPVKNTVLGESKSTVLAKNLVSSIIDEIKDKKTSKFVFVDPKTKKSNSKSSVEPKSSTVTSGCSDAVVKPVALASFDLPTVTVNGVSPSLPKSVPDLISMEKKTDKRNEEKREPKKTANPVMADAKSYLNNEVFNSLDSFVKNESKLLSTHSDTVKHLLFLYYHYARFKP